MKPQLYKVVKIIATEYDGSEYKLDLSDSPMFLTIKSRQVTLEDAAIELMNKLHVGKLFVKARTITEEPTIKEQVEYLNL